MATLTETAYYSRKIINLSIIALLIFLGLRILYTTTVAIWNTLFPTPPPPANHAFGQLTFPLNQADSASPSAKITYVLQTVDGSLPVLPKTFKVYALIQPDPNFNSFNSMKNLAGRMDFAGSPNQVGPTSWKFVDTATPLRTLVVDEVSENFNLNYNFQADPNLFQEKSLVTSDQSYPGSFLQSLGILPPEISNNQVASYFRNDGGKLVPTTSLSTADALQISFNRDDIDKTPVISPNPDKSLVSVIISPSSNSKKKVIQANYYYYPVDFQNSGTYDLTTSQLAYDMLTQGQAFFAKLPKNTNNIVIREVFLAYLDPYPAQPYLQPVLVFSDGKDFLAYVPGVTSSWLLKPGEQSAAK